MIYCWFGVLLLQIVTCSTHLHSKILQNSTSTGINADQSEFTPSAPDTNRPANGISENAPVASVNNKQAKSDLSEGDVSILASVAASIADRATG